MDLCIALMYRFSLGGQRGKQLGKKSKNKWCLGAMTVTVGFSSDYGLGQRLWLWDMNQL